MKTGEEKEFIWKSEEQNNKERMLKELPEIIAELKEKECKGEKEENDDLLIKICSNAFEEALGSAK